MDLIPPDDILIEYAKSSELKKRAITLLLDEKCKNFLLLTKASDDQYWVAAEIPPEDTVGVIGMVIEQYAKTYGPAWVQSLLYGILASRKDEAITTLELVLKNLKESQ